MVSECLSQHVEDSNRLIIIGELGKTMKFTNAMKPDHQILYPVGNDDKGGCLMLFGEPHADKLAILCAGKYYQ